MNFEPLMAPLLVYGWQGLALAIWVALAIGSFLNVVIYRLPVMLQRDWQAQAREVLEIPESHEPLDQTRFNLSVPRSRCPNCSHQIRFWENIPILSWLILRAKCSSCAAPISWRYPAVEALTALLTIAVLSTFGFTTFGIAACLFTWGLVALTFIDFDTQLLPDQITLPMLWLGLITHGFLSGPVPLGDAVLGAVTGYMFLWLTYWGFKLLTGKEGMGYGDFKLLGALGAWMGWIAIPSIILLAAVSGLIYFIILFAIRKHSTSEPIPFGPFLAIAGWVTLVFRDSVLSLFSI